MKTKICIVGARGRLGAAYVRKWSDRYDVTPLTRADLDLSDVDAVYAAISQSDADVVVNCAAEANLETCEDFPQNAHRINCDAPAAMARACAGRGKRLIHISTDYVFDGTKADTLYTEEDEARPISVYGTTKLAGENAVLAASARHVVIRVSWLFGPDKPSFVDALIDRAIVSDQVSAVGDKTSSPTLSDDVVDWSEHFLDPSARGGLYHACNSGRCSWRDYAEFAIRETAALGIAVKSIDVEPIPLETMSMFVAKRPTHTAMSCDKLAAEIGVTPRHWHAAVRDFVRAKFSL